MCLQYKSFQNTAVKGEIARNEQFLLFPRVFSTRFKNFLPFSSDLKLSSANSFSLEESKTCRLGKGNNIFQDLRNKILSQQLTQDRSYIYEMLFWKGK